MLHTIVIFLGAIALMIGLSLLILSFFKRLDNINHDIARLLGSLQLLGGILSLWSLYTEILITSYAFAVVGTALIIITWLLAYQLRPRKAKRKSKPKNL